MNRRVKPAPLAILWLASCALLSGCGGGNLSGVHGVVTLDGEPLENARVEFTPVSGGDDAQGRPAAAITDADGGYTLIYGRDQTGAVPGKYNVSIRTYRSGNPDADDPADQKASKEVVPAKYNANTELTETVEEGGSEINFDLKSEGGEIQLPAGAEPIEE